MSRRDDVPVVWTAPVLGGAGYEHEARGFVLALDDAGVDVRLNPLELSLGWQTRLSSGAAERLEHLLCLDAPLNFVHVLHCTPDLFTRDPRAALHVGRTMFESDSLLPDWAVRCNELDEVWVPSDFNLETFARGGVDPAKLWKICPGLELSDVSGPPLELGTSGFVFLSVFSWGIRKGGDVLVRAFVEEFAPVEPVSLVIKTDRLLLGWARAQLELFVRSVLGREPSDCPRLMLLGVDLAVGEMPRLYAAADAYVLPSRGEGWGRPYIEAMAAGLPTIGTRWSGNLEFMSDENSYLVECEVVPVPDEVSTELPAYAGQRWAEPSVKHLRTLLREVFEERGAANRKGLLAREQIRGTYTHERSAAAVLERLRAHGLDDRASRRKRTMSRLKQRRFRLVWTGPQFVHSSLGHVNRELCRALLGSGRVELSIRSDDPGAFLDREPGASALAARVERPLSGPPDAEVRLSWPPDFSSPENGRLVLILPWELGSLPTAWIERLRSQVDEIWAPTRYVRDCMLASGLDPDRVAVVPHGVNPLRFNRHAHPLPLATEKGFRFLFVGGTLPRKGADILLETYLDAFTAEDDVCLVIKDVGVESFYRGQGLGKQIRQLQADPRNPEILYLHSDLPDALLPCLYRACNCLVAPYRGEGFCLPLAEAMACGLGVIATGHGPALDFCDSSVALLIPARIVTAAEARIGEWQTVSRPWWAEVDRPALAQAMRRAHARPDETRALGARASEHILREFTWKHTAATALGRLEQLAEERSLADGRASRSQVRRRELSVCMIVKDEEAFLQRCLDSVQGLADEVIVIDTGSNDRTVEIARSAGAQVRVIRWEEDFGAARNESLHWATKDWILVLDADETVDPASHDEIRRLVQTEALVGYTLRTLNYLDPGGSASIVEHANLRLFPNHPDLRYVGTDPHAQLQPRHGAVLFQIMPCEAVIHHDGYRPQHLEGRGKGERNRVLLERAVEREPENGFHAFNLGVTYYGLGRDHDAETMLSRAIALCGEQVERGIFPLYLLSSHLTLALVLFRRERYVEAGEQCRAALRLAPGFADAHATLAAADARLGRLEEALAGYERALACAGLPVVASTDRSTSGWRSFAGMAEIYMIQERWSEAVACLEPAHSGNPTSPALLIGLAEALEHLGRTDEAERRLRQARLLT